METLCVFIRIYNRNTDIPRETDKWTLQNFQNKILRWSIQVNKSIHHCNTFKNSLLLCYYCCLDLSCTEALSFSVDKYLANEFVKGQNISLWNRNMNAL